MASKKEEIKKEFTFSKVGDLLSKINQKIPIIIESEFKERKFIDSGVLLLNAAMSANMINGGCEFGRIFCLGGDSGTGKSYIALSFAKNCQKIGMGVIYIDTEYTINLEEIKRLGIDNHPDKFKLIRANKVEDINLLLSQLLDSLKEEKIKGEKVKPFLIVLDSLGQTSSNKEKTDLINTNLNAEGGLKVDMTRAKAIAAMFRSINSDLGYLDIPMIVCNHVYLEQNSMYPAQILKGGKALVYSSSIIGMLSKSKLKDPTKEDEMDMNQSGIIVNFKAIKNRIALPKQIKFEISFTSGLNRFSGLDAFLRPEYFDKIGIAQGKMEVDKNTGEMKFTPGGNRWYVSHLDRSVTIKQLFTKEVFTDEVLKKMEPIVNNYFRYKSVEEIEETEKKFNEIIEDIDESLNIDDFDAGDLMN